MVCGSGLNAVNAAADMILAGDADIVVAGGAENMSAAPYALMKARYGYRMNNATMIDTMVNDALWMHSTITTWVSPLRISAISGYHKRRTR